ncbi:hypothetical protein [Paramagnetospirillum magnetotacticum]|uniref:hypothetical protein n=1 Tax=Paramagnetospirillum magnetotacticum TaxID=188 RepID=UPI0005975BD3|nr:hypothetical protein [Paramagnetospirillum magnetotacticum]
MTARSIDRRLSKLEATIQGDEVGFIVYRQPGETREQAARRGAARDKSFMLVDDPLALNGARELTVVEWLALVAIGREVFDDDKPLPDLRHLAGQWHNATQ